MNLRIIIEKISALLTESFFWKITLIMALIIIPIILGGIFILHDWDVKDKIAKESSDHPVVSTYIGQINTPIDKNSIFVSVTNSDFYQQGGWILHYNQTTGKLLDTIVSNKGSWQEYTSSIGNEMRFYSKRSDNYTKVEKSGKISSIIEMDGDTRVNGGVENSVSSQKWNVTFNNTGGKDSPEYGGSYIITNKLDGISKVLNLNVFSEKFGIYQDQLVFFHTSIINPDPYFIMTYDMNKLQLISDIKLSGESMLYASGGNGVELLVSEDFIYMPGYKDTNATISKISRKTGENVRNLILENEYYPHDSYLPKITFDGKQIIAFELTGKVIRINENLDILSSIKLQNQSVLLKKQDHDRIRVDLTSDELKLYFTNSLEDSLMSVFTYDTLTGKLKNKVEYEIPTTIPKDFYIYSVEKFL